MLFQSCFVNVETTSINIRRLNFHFQPNINVDVFSGRCLAFIMMVLMMIFKSTVKNTPSSIWSGSVNTFHDIRILVKQLRKLIRNLISDVVKIIKLVIVMPAASAVSERSFSAMCRLYTYLRTNMGSSRLNNAMVLHIHKDRLDKLSMVDVANDFVFESDHRKTLFGRFDDVDLRRKSIPVKSVGIQVNMNN